MKRFIAAAAAAAALTGLAGCGGSGTNEAACASALQAVLRGDAPMAKPAACAGLSDERMGELSFHGSPEAADRANAQDAADAVEDAERAASVTTADACRADLADQLAGITQESASYHVSRASGACDGVSDEDMKRMAAVIIYGATR